MKRCVFVAAGLFVPALAAAQQPGTGKPETVALRFAWPQQLIASVESERVRVRKTERLDSTASAVTYRMESGAGKSNELLISFTDFELHAPAAGQTMPTQALLEGVASLVPSYRVTHKGEFLGVYDVAQLKVRLDSMFEPMLKDDESGQLKSLFQSLVSEQYLNSAGAQEWNSLVGMWVGADLELGQVYELEEESPIPLIPGAVVKMKTEFAIEERVPCQQGSADNQCVQIRMYSEPDSAAMRALLQKFMDNLGSAAVNQEMPVFEDLVISSELLLITKPETLVPYYLELVKVVEGRGRVGTEVAPLSQVDRRRYWYSYQ